MLSLCLLRTLYDFLPSHSPMLEKNSNHADSLSAGTDSLFQQPRQLFETQKTKDRFYYVSQFKYVTAGLFVCYGSYLSARVYFLYIFQKVQRSSPRGIVFCLMSYKFKIDTFNLLKYEEKKTMNFTI